MAKPILDAEWHRLITERNDLSIPDDPELNRTFYERWHEENGKSPHGCNLHIAFHDRPEGPYWQCRFSIGGQQRILGYGTCYQMAVLYDSAKIFFAKYRPKSRQPDVGYDTWTYNFSESENKARLSGEHRNLLLVSFLESIEYLLAKRGELTTPEVRAVKRQDRRHRNTNAGQMRYAIENILAILEPMAASIVTIEQELKTRRTSDTANCQQSMKCEICNAGPSDGPTIHRINQPGEMPARWRCEQHMNAEQKAAIDPVVKDIVEIVEDERDSRLKLSEGQNQVIAAIKHFFDNNTEINQWSGTTLQLGRLVKSTVFRYNSNKLAAELIFLQHSHCVDGNWLFRRYLQSQNPDHSGDGTIII